MPPAAAPSDDDALVRRAVAGDADAFVQIVRRHQAAAIRVARALGPPEDAEDAAQEAFMKAHRALARYNTARPLRPWLLAIVANEARDHARRTARRRRLMERVSAASGRGYTAPSAEQLTLERLGPERLVDALAGLRRRERDTILLRYVLDHSEEETAVILGCAPGTVKSRASRGLAHLRAALGEDA